MSIEKVLNDTNSLILDTSVFLGYFLNEYHSITSLLDEYVFNENSIITIYSHNLLKSEIYYVTCRKASPNEARSILNKIEKVTSTINDSWLFENAGKIKCKYPIALSDCFSISLGILQDCPIFFLKERELPEILIDKINKEFNCKIYIVS
ncbi:MAG: PIN domain-containing protein [Promethearchaeota archaeon]